MNVNFEFLSSESIENLITCVRYKIDKVVFFGYHETIVLLKDRTERFLKERCGVQSVVFHAVSHTDLGSVLNTMQEAIAYEKAGKNRIYFDLTGGESLILLAFGMLSKESNLSIHQFDVVSDRLLEFDTGAKTSLSANVEPNDVPVTLDLLVEMQGGKINHEMHKETKDLSDPEYEADIWNIAATASHNVNRWNSFADLLRSVLLGGSDDLTVSKKQSVVKDALTRNAGGLKELADLERILKELEGYGIVQDVRSTEEELSFRIKNRRLRKVLMDGGSVLELVTYLNELSGCDECLVGVHLDWDGEIHPESGIDVVNEVDVLTRKGNVPTFMSCKSGKMGASQSLFALYELNTVARRFGGKYAKKVLVTVHDIGATARERAKEMGIKVTQPPSGRSQEDRRPHPGGTGCR